MMKTEPLFLIGNHVDDFATPSEPSERMNHPGSAKSTHCYLGRGLHVVKKQHVTQTQQPLCQKGESSMPPSNNRRLLWWNPPQLSEFALDEG